MEKFYVPFIGGKPASISINGHRMVVASLDEDALESDLLGSVDIQELVSDRGGALSEFLGYPPEAAGIVTDSIEEGPSIPLELQKVAESVESGVLVIPENMTLDSVISQLEDQLPWIQ